MKKPFNPLPLPESLQLETGTTPPAPLAAGRATDPATKRKRPRQAKPKKIPMKQKCKIKWRQIKNRIHHRLGQLDRNKLKQVLLACGIAGGVVMAIIVASKLVPVAILLLALLGLGAVIRLWDRLRGLPITF